jgi:hypothetical protein
LFLLPNRWNLRPPPPAHQPFEPSYSQSPCPMFADTPLRVSTIFVFNPGAAPPRESSCSDIYFGISKVDAHVHTYA